MALPPHKQNHRKNLPVNHVYNDTIKYGMGWLISLIVLLVVVRKYQGCQDRVGITYLLLAFTVASLVLLEHNLQQHDISVNLLVAFLFALALLVSTHVARPNSTMKTVLFILFVVAMSLILQPLYRLADRIGVAKPALITIGIWFVLLSILSVQFPGLVTSTWGNYLFWALVSLVVGRCVMLFTKATSRWVRISSYLGLIIFSGLVLYDSQNMRRRASQCDHPYDYIDNITQLFLDFINMWSDTMTLGVSNH